MLVAVPNVVGLTQAAATTSITGTGLTVGTVTTASSATVQTGSVISESPTPPSFKSLRYPVAQRATPCGSFKRTRASTRVLGRSRPRLRQALKRGGRPVS